MIQTTEAKKQLQSRQQDAEVKNVALSAAREELRNVIEAYKAKEQGYLDKIEATEIARAKASRGESTGRAHPPISARLFSPTFTVRRTLADLEKQHEALAADRKKLQERLKEQERQLRDLKSKLSDGGKDNSESDMLRQHLVEELEDTRERHQKDLADRDFTIDQTRKKYQAELAQLSEGQ